MTGTPGLSEGVLSNFRDLLARQAEIVGLEWTGLLGCMVTLEPGPAVVRPQAVVPAEFTRGPSLHTTARIEGGATGALRILLPFPTALAIAGRMLMLKDDVIRRKIASSQEVDLDADAYAEAMNIFCGGTGRAFSAELYADISVVQERSRVVSLGSRHVSLDLLFPPAPWVTGTHQLEVEGFPKSPVAVVADPTVAQALLPSQPFQPEASDRRRVVVFPLSPATGASLEAALPRTSYEAVVASDDANLELALAQGAAHAVVVEVAQGRADRVAACKELRSRGLPVFACGARAALDRATLIEVARARVLGVLLVPFDARATLEKLDGAGAA